MILDSLDWHNICQNVTNIALPIFNIPFNTRLRSEIISSLFEIESARYYKSQGYSVNNASHDGEPDLFFLDYNQPLEIKVTKKKKQIKWMGNKISKKDSQFVLIVWDEKDPNLYNDHKTLDFYITTTHLTPNDWSGSDDGYTYHASFLSWKDIISKEKEDLIGKSMALQEYSLLGSNHAATPY